MTFATELTIDDHKDFLRVLGMSSRLRAVFLLTQLMILVAAPLIVFALALFGFTLVETWQNPKLDEILVNPTFLIAVGVGVLMLPVALIWLRWALRRLVKAPKDFKAGSIDESAFRDGFDLGRFEFEALADGLRIARALEEERYLWSAFQEVRETDQALFLMLDDKSGEILPKRAFADEQDCESFKSLAEREIRKAA